jgi:type II secretion system protein N
MALLYYRFPSDALRDYLEATFARNTPQMVLSLGEVSPSFPLGIKFKESRLTLKEEPEVLLFRANSFLVSSRIWAFLRGQSYYRFKSQAYGGTVKGRIHFIENRLEAPFNTSMTLKDIHIDKNTFLSNILNSHLKGVLEGTIRYRAKNNVLRQGRGEASFKLSSGSIEFLEPILSLESIDFKEFLIKMVLKKQTIDLSNTELKGTSMNGVLWGFISLKEEFLKSRLNLRVTIEPFADLIKNLGGDGDSLKSFKQRLKSGKLSFFIRGTIGDPRIQLI